MNLRALENWVFGRVKDPGAAEVAQRPVRSWDLTGWERHKYCLLTTYRRDGTPVNTPVWFGIAGQRLYIRSGAEDGKVKRVRHEPRVLLAPCTARGRPLTDPMPGRARLLAPEQCGPAEAALRQHYGLGRRAYKIMRRRLDVAYLEVAGDVD